MSSCDPVECAEAEFGGANPEPQAFGMSNAGTYNAAVRASAPRSGRTACQYGTCLPVLPCYRPRAANRAPPAVAPRTFLHVLEMRRRVGIGTRPMAAGASAHTPAMTSGTYGPNPSCPGFVTVHTAAQCSHRTYSTYGVRSRTRRSSCPHTVHGSSTRRCRRRSAGGRGCPGCAGNSAS
jgi:hypothetical protein